jgi:TM2 domain-containing membrane protein YozV
MNEICPRCGKVSGEQSPRFCSSCGARMDGKTPAEYPVPPSEQKSTTVAGFCSSVLPGLGQVYNGETVKGFALFLLTLAGLVLLVIPGLVVWLYAMYDAYAVAAKMNTGEIPFRETRTIQMVIFIFFTVIVVVVTILILIAMVMALVTSQFGSLSTGSHTGRLTQTGSDQGPVNRGGVRSGVPEIWAKTSAPEN